MRSPESQRRHATLRTDSLLRVEGIVEYSVRSNNMTHHHAVHQAHSLVLRLRVQSTEENFTRMSKPTVRNYCESLIITKAALCIYKNKDKKIVQVCL